MLSSVVLRDDIVCIAENLNGYVHIGILSYDYDGNVLLHSPRLIEIIDGEINLNVPMGLGNINGFINFGNITKWIAYVPNDNLIDLYINECDEYINNATADSYIDNFVLYSQEIH